MMIWDNYPEGVEEFNTMQKIFFDVYHFNVVSFRIRSELTDTEAGIEVGQFITSWTSHKSPDELIIFYYVRHADHDYDKAGFAPASKRPCYLQ